MKSNYKSPIIEIISLSNEDAILSSSGTLNGMNIGVGLGSEKGSNALGNSKDMWGKSDMWK